MVTASENEEGRWQRDKNTEGYGGGDEAAGRLHGKRCVSLLTHRQQERRRGRPGLSCRGGEPQPNDTCGSIQLVYDELASLAHPSGAESDAKRVGSTGKPHEPLRRSARSWRVRWCRTVVLAYPKADKPSSQMYDLRRPPESSTRIEAGRDPDSGSRGGWRLLWLAHLRGALSSLMRVEFG
jgi:hypothetical protein